MPHRHAVWLLAAIVLGVVAGGVSGWYFGEAMVAVGWLGELFLRTLKMLILPLIIAAVISGVAALGDVRKLGRVGWLTLTYYLVTTATAVFIGLVVVNLIEPGVGLTPPSDHAPDRIAAKADTGVVDILLSLVDANLVDAAANTRLLPIILFSILLAAALTTVGQRGVEVIRFFEGVNEAMMRLVIWLMYLAPVGIFALVAARLGQAGGGDAFFQELSAVGRYVVTVLTGLALHAAVLMLFLRLFAKRGGAYLTGVLRALMTAFGTASSSATLPLTMECAREQGVDDRSVRFVLPLGSTVNMNGTALYEAVAALFIAQAYGLELSMAQQSVVLITASLAAIGAAGIPEAGLVTLVIVLQAVGLPLEGVALLLAVDWFLDRFRTAVNVWGDAVGAAFIERHLPQADP